MAREVRLIDKNGGEVTAYDDAVIRYLNNNASGNDVGGIVKGLGNELSLTLDTANKRLIVGSGRGMFYGRRFEVRQGEEPVIDVSPYTSNRYIAVYLTLDTRDQSANGEYARIDVSTSSADYPTPNPGTDLYANPNGTARLLLYLVLYRPNGTTDIRRQAPLYEYNNAQHALNATNVLSTGSIAGVSVPTLIDTSKGTVKRANDATSADAVSGKKIDSLLKLYEIVGQPRILLTVPFDGYISDNNLTTSGMQFVSGNYLGKYFEPLYVIYSVNIINWGSYDGVFSVIGDAQGASNKTATQTIRDPAGTGTTLAYLDFLGTYDIDNNSALQRIGFKLRSSSGTKKLSSFKAQIVGYLK